jgi:hypothetical protein
VASITSVVAIWLSTSRSNLSALSSRKRRRLPRKVWESQAAADRFLTEKLGAALRRANISIQPDAFNVHNIMKALLLS